MKSRYFLGGREFFGETTLIHFPKSSAIFGNSVAVHIQNDITQTSTVGETQSAIRAGILGKNNLTEIGLILGNAKGRTSNEEFTIFDCTGIAGSCSFKIYCIKSRRNECWDKRANIKSIYNLEGSYYEVKSLYIKFICKIH